MTGAEYMKAASRLLVAYFITFFDGLVSGRAGRI